MQSISDQIESFVPEEQLIAKAIAGLKEKNKEAKLWLDAIASLEENLKTAKDRLRRLTEEEMPELFSNIGVTSLPLDTGETLTVNTELHCGIPASNKEAALQWLRDNHFGDIIKNEITVKLAKKEGNLSAPLKEQIELLGLNYDEKESVNSQTLKAFIKEQKRQGKEIPNELFGVYIRKFVDVKHNMKG